MEGPFISKEKKGAHDINYIKDEVKDLNTIQDVYGSLDGISIITVAPELIGMMDVIPKLVEKQISVSIGNCLLCVALSYRRMYKLVIDFRNSYY